MTVLEFFRFLRHNARGIILFTLAGLLLSAAFAFSRPVVYESAATGIVVAGDNTSVGGAMSGHALAKQRASVYITLAGTGAVRERALAQPEVQAAPEAGRGAISAEALNETIIRVTATGNSAENARILADAALTALAEEAVALEALTVDSAAPQDPGATPTADPADPNAAPGEGNIAVRLAKYSPAYLSGEPVSPNWVEILAVGTGLGLLLGLLIAFLRRQLDVRVRTMKDVEDTTGHGVLGVIPDSKEFAKQREGGRISLATLGTTGEALRQLRTNLRFVDVDNPPRSIVVSSSNPGEGKSTISSVLSVLMARSGQPVVLIDADLRKPVQHKTFNADNAVGLSQVLVGDVAVEDALQPTNEPNLYVLTAGRVPSNPSEMVGSKRMRALIEKLAENYFVITDAPPVLAVTDAPLLAASTDGVVLVTRVGVTRKEQLNLAVKLVKQVGGTVLGTVMHRARAKAMGETVYGAGYGGSYQSYYGEGYLAAEDDEKAPVSADNVDLTVVRGPDTSLAPVTPESAEVKIAKRRLW